jgi:hypothetical protein
MRPLPSWQRLSAMLYGVMKSSKAWGGMALVVALGACSENSGGILFVRGGSLGQAGLPGIGTADPAAGGTNAQGGSGFAGSAILAAATTTKYGACVAYMQAQCQRRFGDCGERSSMESPCSSAIDRCPDSLFAPGSTWTVVSVLSCAEEWKSFSCDEIRQNKRPGCSLPRGTRQLDEPCLFANQCASNTCTEKKKDGTGITGYDSCRVCGEQSGLGGVCGQAGYDCSLELTCGYYSKQCEARAPMGIVGSTCADDSTCTAYGISCRTDPTDGVKRCLTLPVGGESCAESGCATGYLCSAKVCVSGPTLGQTCGAEGPAECGAGLVCSSYFDTPAHTCIAPRKVGEVCIGDARRRPRGTCEVGLRCDCQELDCESKSGICRTVHAEGEACGEANSICAPGTACIDAKCTALDSQPALVKLCPQ